MPRLFLILIASFATVPVCASTVQLLPLLPKGAVTSAIQLDSSGNIYVAGTTTAASPQDSPDAFVAKFSADGSKQLYLTYLAGSQQDGATGIAIGSDGSAYVTGNTQSGDFPATAGAMQTTNPMPGQLQGFLAKLNPAGAIVYATYITSPAVTQMNGIALDSAGDVFLTGIGAQVNATLGSALVGFILKFDPTLSKVLMTVNGTGGGPIQLDAQGNIYVAGSAQPNVGGSFTLGQTLPLPTLSANAFQPTHNATVCITFGSGPGGNGGSYFCRYQYVAKLNAAGNVLWATYVDGAYGATARGIAVDSAGNVTIAGTTNSDDYPVTPGAFQTAFSAAAPPYPVATGSTYSDPPSATGYITKVNSTGTALLWSTYFGGSSSDSITGMAIAPGGDIIISGRAGSSDLPGLEGTPAGCDPSAVQKLGFVARVAPDGATAGPTQLIIGAPDCTYLNCPISSNYTDYGASWPVAVNASGVAVTGGTNGSVATVDFQASSRLTCITDPADNVQLRSVAPGQLVSLFGEDLAPLTNPTSGVFFNGVAAPILYSSPQQINSQVPFSLSGQTSVQMQVVNTQLPSQLSETHTLAVTVNQPSVFLATSGMTSPFPGYTQCGGTVAIGPAALAINADGTVNDCAHPASANSTVTIFVNGLGKPSPPSVTILNPNSTNLNAVTTPLPGTSNGVDQVQFKVPSNAAALTNVYPVVPSLSGVTLRERLALIWVGK